MVANLGWPRTEGVLIKVEMKTNGNNICAIVDTGSQLDVVRADVMALKVGHAVDMNQVTNMNDANGGTGQLQGWIRDVEFTCGAAVTVTDLWVSHRAPFALLLGQPWQRGNLVSIDEREEGTYLIFKDRKTRCPRFELLAVPYDGPPIGTTSGPINQYMSFSFSKEMPSLTDLPAPVPRPEAVEIQRAVGDAHKEGWKIALNGRVEKIHQEYQVELRRKNATLRAVLAAHMLEEALRVSNRHSAGEICAVLAEPLQRRRRAEAIPSQEHLLQKRANKRSQENKGPILLTRAGVLGCLQSLREREDQQADYIKGMFAPRPSPTCCAPVLISYPMSLLSDNTNTSTGHDACLRLVSGQPPPFQYLSRAHFPHGPMPSATLSPYRPVATIMDAVSGIWQRQDLREPMDLSPTFSSSLQAIHYGRTVLPDGQILHRSAAMNTFQVFQDADTGTPVTMSGHKFTFHVACPEKPHVLWSLEAPYPTEAQMHNVMRRFVPPTVSGAVALTL
ncbi:hypothetical protein K438DRAFT_1981055 [Mycena galopus ATCC 62051]|nr:hypothetical protein K438DRAFT_1981055 [Mycena galopus ATCC 62051]